MEVNIRHARFLEMLLLPGLGMDKARNLDGKSKKALGNHNHGFIKVSIGLCGGVDERFKFLDKKRQTFDITCIVSLPSRADTKYLVTQVL